MFNNALDVHKVGVPFCNQRFEADRNPVSDVRLKLTPPIEKNTRAWGLRNSPELQTNVHQTGEKADEWNLVFSWKNMQDSTSTLQDLASLCGDIQTVVKKSVNFALPIRDGTSDFMSLYTKCRVKVGSERKIYARVGVTNRYPLLVSGFVKDSLPLTFRMNGGAD